MHPRARELIDRLGLAPHPEGGMFRRTFQSSRSVQPEGPRGPRVALTAIYYLLVDRGISRWHRVASDEAWHWIEGAPLDLYTATSDGAISSRALGPLSDRSMPQHVVPAGAWQAARCSGDYTLAGCCVAPGFEFADFSLLASLPAAERPILTPAALLAEFL